MVKKVTSPVPQHDQLLSEAFSLQEGALAELASGLALKSADLKRAWEFVERQEAENPLTELHFELPGETPVAKRPRSSGFMRDNGKIGVKVYAADGKSQRSLRQEIAASLPPDFVPFEGEVELGTIFYRSIPGSWPSYKKLLAELGYLRAETKPDADNQLKLVVDAMRGVVFVDDAQVVLVEEPLLYSIRPRMEAIVRGRRFRMTK